MGRVAEATASNNRRGGEERQREAGGERQDSGKWSLPGFIADPGSAGGWQSCTQCGVALHSEGSADTGAAAGTCWQGNLAGGWSSQGGRENHRLDAKWWTAEEGGRRW